MGTSSRLTTPLNQLTLAVMVNGARPAWLPQCLNYIPGGSGYDEAAWRIAVPWIHDIWVTLLLTEGGFRVHFNEHHICVKAN